MIFTHNSDEIRLDHVASKLFALGFFLCFLSFLAPAISAQDLYDLETIQEIEINFNQSNWDQLMDDQKAGAGDYIMAQSVSINGEVFDSVGVKYKGNSTYDADQTKNPLHIELDTFKNHDYQGFTDIKLSNGARDPSFLREVLSYQILGQYADAPLSNFANVTINGTLIGLYSNAESISKKFVDKHFDSRRNAFINCNPVDVTGTSSDVFPDLQYLGNNVISYLGAYELKSDEGWDDLLNLCDTLNNNIEAIEAILDVDRTLWMLAFDNALVNLDSYIGAIVQNYYLYRQDNGRFVPIVWDLNESFGRANETGSMNLNSTTAKQQLDVFLHENDSEYPLIQQLLSIPTYRKRYLAHYKTMLLENFDNGSYINTAETLRALIDQSFQNDTNRFFSYDDFSDNLENDVNTGGGPSGISPGIMNLMDGRSSFLLASDEFTAAEPNFAEITLSNDNPELGENLLISAQVENADFVSLAYRNEEDEPFSKLEMRDDGSNGDDVAGDGIYSILFPLEHTFYEYYYYAENSDIGKFEPQRAEHEFLSLQATIPIPEITDLVINEFMASNFESVSDSEGEFDDWIELFNNGSSSIDLNGYSLSDDAGQLTRWSFPPGTSIGSNEYLIVWADKDEDQSGLHTNFKLSASAEGVFLSNPSGEVIDLVTYENQESDLSFARFPNGTGPFQSMNPTFNAENEIVSSVPESLQTQMDFLIYPNPVEGTLNVKFDNNIEKPLLLELFNQSGQVVFRNESWLGESLPTTTLKNGFYFLSIKDVGFISTQKFLIQR